jgi:hypothetical protein
MATPGISEITIPFPKPVTTGIVNRSADREAYTEILTAPEESFWDRNGAFGRAESSAFCIGTLWEASDQRRHVER